MPAFERNFGALQGITREKWMMIFEVGAPLKLFSPFFHLLVLLLGLSSSSFSDSCFPFSCSSAPPSLRPGYGSKERYLKNPFACSEKTNRNCGPLGLVMSHNRMWPCVATCDFDQDGVKKAALHGLRSWNEGVVWPNFLN